ncbi:MAG: hypothetical protein V7636_1145 [Actinomycetota bacterium]|jgi:hypothetical protein
MRTPSWAYVYRLDGRDEVYDRAADPRELINVATSLAHASVVREMRDETLRWLVDTSDVVPPDEDPRFPRIPHGCR